MLLSIYAIVAAPESKTRSTTCYTGKVRDTPDDSQAGTTVGNVDCSSMLPKGSKQPLVASFPDEDNTHR